MTTISRRHLIVAGTLGGGLSLAGSGGRAQALPAGAIVDARALGLSPDNTGDQSRPMQEAIDQTAAQGAALLLPAGRYRIADIRIDKPVALIGSAGGAVLSLSRPGRLFNLSGSSICFEHLVLDGEGASDGALLRAEDVSNLLLDGLTVRNSASGGIALFRCAGTVTTCTFEGIAETALFALDSAGLDISRNGFSNIGNNAIQVWRSEAGEDGTKVFQNRIAHVRADRGGSGQYGNGVNVFRAGSVSVADNRITDCAFSAVRVNAGSNVQIIGNSCERLGEVAIYAEFGFQGAVISNNMVDHAALGVSITNFNHGGRLAVCSGNLIRNLFTRTEGEARGVGIAVEADAAVTGNVIENAPRAGIMVGWGRYQRDVTVTGNLVRTARWGIAASVSPGAGRVLIGQNMLADCSEAAIIGHQNGRGVTTDLARAAPDAIPVNLSIMANAA